MRAATRGRTCRQRADGNAPMQFVPRGGLRAGSWPPATRRGLNDCHGHALAIRLGRMGNTLAIMITSTTYGTWLRGDKRGWIDDGRLMPPLPWLEANDRTRMAHEPFL